MDNSNTFDYFTKKFGKTNKHYQNVIVDKSDHMHQTDGNIFNTFELELRMKKMRKSKNYQDHKYFPASDRSLMYQYMIGLWLQFLYKNGVYNEKGVDPKFLKKRIDHFKNKPKDTTGHLYDPAEDFELE